MPDEHYEAVKESMQRMWVQFRFAPLEEKVKEMTLLLPSWDKALIDYTPAEIKAAADYYLKSDKSKVPTIYEFQAVLEGKRGGENAKRYPCRMDSPELMARFALFDKLTPVKLQIATDNIHEYCEMAPEVQLAFNKLNPIKPAERKELRKKMVLTFNTIIKRVRETPVITEHELEQESRRIQQRLAGRERGAR